MLRDIIASFLVIGITLFTSASRIGGHSSERQQQGTRHSHVDLSAFVYEHKLRTKTSDTALSLCIYSKVAADVGNPSIIDGHTAIMLVDTSESPTSFTTYALYSDFSGKVRSNGIFNSDVRTNLSKDKWSADKYPYIFCTPISTSQRKTFQKQVSNTWYWTGTTDCASFASEVFYKVTGIDVNADDEVAGIETPRELGKSIRALNGGTNQCSLPWK